MQLDESKEKKVNVKGEREGSKEYSKENLKFEGRKDERVLKDEMKGV